MSIEHPALRPSRIEINLDAYAENLHHIRQHTGVPVMAIVKANAYGHGLVPMAQQALASGAVQLGVAIAEEGLALRQAGIQAPILVLGGVLPTQLAACLHAQLEITVPSMMRLAEVLAAAEQLAKPCVVHLKIDTGMARIGVPAEHAADLIEAALASPWCHIKGIFSHLACADEPDSPMTGQQLERFLSACHYFERIGAPMPLRHLANSGAVMNFPETWLDMVRPGIMSYGVLPGKDCRPAFVLQPVLALKSVVTHIKPIAADTPVSYGATWRSAQASHIATIPLGYGDGWSRQLSSRGAVLIGGQRKTIAGRVCMDQFMVDVGSLPVALGDEVVLIGRQGGAAIDIEEVAECANTIGYELLTHMSARLPRVYFKNGQVIAVSQ
ncbi:alanine racemase [Lysobacteraceae bacterium NML120232]|nr:alanine racemase [Xanthomonadaceae bacterium NML120232]